MKTIYQSPYVVVVNTGDTSDTYLDAGIPISTRMFSAKLAWALLSPVDCSYTLVFEDGEQGSATVPILSDDPHTDEEKAKFLALFATHDKVTIKGLHAVKPKPEGPYCTCEGKYLSVKVGTNNWLWPLGETIYKRNLSTADIAALCNPRKCKARINAYAKNNTLIAYFNLGTLTPAEMLEYDAFVLLNV